MDVKSGWECPKCKSIYGPDVKKCKKCSKTTNESTNTTEQLLNE